jgi:hypothetical protein
LGEKEEKEREREKQTAGSFPRARHTLWLSFVGFSLL